MIINDNGVIREMTSKEVDEYELMKMGFPKSVPTPEERIAQLERDNADLKEALELLLSGEVSVDG